MCEVYFSQSTMSREQIDAVIDPIKILLPYINIANQHVVHIKLTQVIYQLYLNF